VCSPHGDAFSYVCTVRPITDADAHGHADADAYGNAYAYAHSHAATTDKRCEITKERT
jgi:hypothetical protein